MIADVRQSADSMVVGLQARFFACACYMNSKSNVVRGASCSQGTGISRTLGRSTSQTILPLVRGIDYKRLAAACCYFTPIVSVRVGTAPGFIVASCGPVGSAQTTQWLFHYTPSRG